MTQPLTQIEPLLSALREHKACELYLQAGTAPHVQKNGVLLPLPGAAPQSEEELLGLLRELLPEGRWGEPGQPQDLSWSVTLDGATRLRCRAQEHAGGLELAVRAVVPVPSLSDLRAPAVLGRLCQTRGGLLIITGPTGSGRSTTLHAILDGINETQARHIVTIEDPVSFVHSGKRSVVVQREVGTDAVDPLAALTFAQRQDADVVALDPLWDSPLAGPQEALLSAALLLAEAGVLVLVSLQAGRCVQAVDLLIAAFPPEQQIQVRQRLGGLLRAVVAQRLCRAPDGQLVAAHEILLGGPQLPAAMREGGPALLAYLAGGKRQGMQTLEDSLEQLLVAGVISEREARLHGGDWRRFGPGTEGQG